MNNRHARPLRIQGRMKPAFDTFHHDAPFARLVNAGENFTQRAFARAVLAHDCVAASGGYFKTDVLKRNRSRETLADATKADGWMGFDTQGNTMTIG